MRPTLARVLPAACLVALVAAAPAGAKGFAYGVAAGEVDADSAIVWTRAPSAGAVTLDYGTSPDRLTQHRQLTARKSHDLTVQATLGSLRADTRYAYAFRQGDVRSQSGRFRTAPKPTASKSIRFAWSGDADAQPARRGGKPFYNNFEVYARMANAGNDFNVNLGDTIYSDTEVGATIVGGKFVSPAPALTVPQKWAKYRQNLALRNLQKLRAAGALYSQWDDHEFINDFTMAEDGRAVYRAGVRAFRDYAPVTYTPRDGLYRSFRWGRNLEVFFLDGRSFRSGKASANHLCDNPQTGAPDVAPTAPQSTRALFALVVPSLGAPVPPACLVAINDPSRTLLGGRQFDRFTAAIKRSTATFKVIFNEQPIQQVYALPYDRYEGYEAERKRLLTFLRDNVKNAVFLATDVHANWVNDARLQTLEPGGPQNTGILDVTTGPVATKTQAKEVDEVVGRPGAGELIADAFYKPPPPSGVGMTCSSNDTYSFGQVDVTSASLRIRLLDLNGRPVKDAAGPPCATITIRASG